MPGALKGLAVLLFGKVLIPALPWTACFFARESRAVLAAVNRVPVCLVGGVASLEAAEGAVREGFPLVQVARALIREPDFVRRITEELQDRAGSNEPPPGDMVSPCSHCNECVVGWRLGVRFAVVSSPLYQQLLLMLTSSPVDGNSEPGTRIALPGTNGGH